MRRWYDFICHIIVERRTKRLTTGGAPRRDRVRLPIPFRIGHGEKGGKNPICSRRRGLVGERMNEGESSIVLFYALLSFLLILTLSVTLSLSPSLSHTLSVPLVFQS